MIPMTNVENTAQRHRDNLGRGGMDRTGVITLSADSLAAAAERVESLGCVVLLARPVSPGKYSLDVDLPSLESGYAVAYAVARGSIEWCRSRDLCRAVS